jgi:DNA-binding MarR family transcriptional regulator
VVKRRDQIEAYIAAYAQEHHNSPSAEHLAGVFNMSRQMVDKHIQKLIDEGRAERIDGDLKLVGATYTPPVPA